MKHLYKAFSGALLVLGLAGLHSVPAMAGGYRYDAACHCMRPDAEYTTRRVVRQPAQVRVHRRVVYRTRVVRGRTRLIQHNRVIVHVRPVIDREVVVHRTNTVVRDVILHRTNTFNRWRNEYHTEVVNLYEPGWVRHVVVDRSVRGCGCERYGGGYGGYYRRGLFVSYRD
jgi:hypothetical protein